MPTQDKTLTKLTLRHEQILAALARYRFLDSKHLYALINCANTNAKRSIADLLDVGLIEHVPNPKFQRSETNAPLVYQLSNTGRTYLEERGLMPLPATYVTGQGILRHNLIVCHALASIEVACINASRTFLPWGELLSNAPGITQALKSPHRFKLHDGDVVPDAIFSIEYPHRFACFALEIDLTNHGMKDYADKAQRYQELIFGKFYQKHLGMRQHFYVLTITTNQKHTELIKRAAEGRVSPFLYRTMPQYGSYTLAPEPALDILTGWQGNHPNLGDLDGHCEAA